MVASCLYKFFSQHMEIQYAVGAVKMNLLHKWRNLCKFGHNRTIEGERWGSLAARARRYVRNFLPLEGNENLVIQCSSLFVKSICNDLFIKICNCAIVKHILLRKILCQPL
jgi:hypothetical protein